VTEDPVPSTLASILEYPIGPDAIGGVNFKKSDE
jgi:hypothetical protein